jgi:hypothetical protein
MKPNSFQHIPAICPVFVVAPMSPTASRMASTPLQEKHGTCAANAANAGSNPPLWWCVEKGNLHLLSVGYWKLLKHE